LAEEQITQLADGVTVVSEVLDHVRSAAIGCFIDVGSAAETPEQAGYSHLLEHLLFRGTTSYTSEQIDQRFDAMGAEINAGTGKENTSVFTRVLDTHIDEAFAMLGEMVWQPNIAEPDVAQEREIVLEELAMYEDDPQDRVFDLAAQAVFGDDPLGRPVIGTREVVGSAEAPVLHAFHQERYGGGRIVVAAAGAIEHDHLVDLTEQTIAAAHGSRRGPGAAVARASEPHTTDLSLRVVEKQTEQTHFVLGGLGVARDDDRRFALRILDAILGGTSSSRLFQEIREKRGLAYAVYSFVSFFESTGQIGLYLGTRPDNVAKSLDVVAAELDRLHSGGVTASELDRARENVKGRTVLAMESTPARMNRLGSSLLADLPLLSMDDVVERLDAVTADDVLSLAREYYNRANMAVAGIGPDRVQIENGALLINPGLQGVAA
jgi:predicted Zn-dependent peptidase